MNKRAGLFVGLIVCIGLASCNLFPPSKNTSEYLKTETGGFVIAKSDKAVCYSLTLSSVKPVQTGALLEATYENPAGGSPYTSTLVAGSNQNTFELKSPPIQGLHSGHTYMIEVSIYSNSSKQTLLGQHTQGIQSPFSMPLD
jgi:hypothetical protein